MKFSNFTTFQIFHDLYLYEPWMQKYEKKKEKGEKVHASIKLRSKVCHRKSLAYIQQLTIQYIVIEMPSYWFYVLSFAQTDMKNNK